MKGWRKLKRFIGILCITVISVAIVIIAFASPITKYLIEKYSIKLTGRQIRMNWAYVNPFTGYVHFDKLKIYNQQGDSIFILMDGLSADFALRKLFSKTYEITSITLDKPWIKIVQKRNIFNFQDIIDHFASKKNASVKDTINEPLHLNILNIKIHDGEFHYVEQEMGVNYFIKRVNIESPGKWWNIDTMDYRFAFESGSQTGDVKGNCLANMRNADYHLAVTFKQFDLQVFEQYLKEFANYGKFYANLDANIDATGNFANAVELDAKGKLSINDFHIGKYTGSDYASFKRFNIDILELSPKNNRYSFDSLTLVSPYILYEQYDYLNNYERMFGEKGSNITPVAADPARNNVLVEIAHYVSILASEFFKSDFKINRVAIYKAILAYNDYSVREKFSIQTDSLNIIADSIYKNHNRVNVRLISKIKPYGDMTVKLSISPKNYEDFDLKFHLTNLPLALFNPYTVTYTSFPFDRGTISFDADWNVRSGNIQGKNHLIIVDPYTGKRERKKDTKWVPLPLIMAFIKERGDVIDYEIPITGNLKNPKYHLKYVLLDMLDNIFIKPPTIPYGVKVRNLEKEIKGSLIVNWAMGSSELQRAQIKFVKKIAAFLKDHPDASIAVHPIEYSDKELEHILFYEAKKKYYLASEGKLSSPFARADSLKVDGMSNKDSSFVRYLNKFHSNRMMFTIQDKCAASIDGSYVKKKYNELQKERRTAFLSFFEKNNAADRVKIYAAKSEIPYDGFSFYQINYNGLLPDELKKAYQQMNEINNGWFRRKYKAIRNGELTTEK